MSKAYTMSNRANMISNKMRCAFMKLDSDLKEQRVSGLSILFMSAGLCMISMSAQADFSDIDPSLKTAPYTCPANPTNAQDPANHKMYVVAVNPRPDTPKATLPLVWAAGTNSKSFSWLRQWTWAFRWDL